MEDMRDECARLMVNARNTQDEISEALSDLSTNIDVTIADALAAATVKITATLATELTETILKKVTPALSTTTASLESIAKTVASTPYRDALNRPPHPTNSAIDRALVQEVIRER